MTEDFGIDHATVEPGSVEECGECGDEYREPPGLKADTGACPACDGGDLS